MAAVALALLLAGTIALYLLYCSKHPTKKLKAEITVIAIAIVCSLAIRMVVGYAALPDRTFAGGAVSFFHGLFSSTAGLTFNSLLELGEVAGGILACLYYGVIVYASFVFLIVVTVGLSYEFYSRVQIHGLRRRFSSYYIFTTVTPDTILLALSIKNHFEEERKRTGKKHKYVIIFYENGEESFSRKNQLHCKLMENGFYYYSDFRRDDRGNVVSFLKKFKFRRKDFKRDECGDVRNKLFNVFAMGDCGGFEGDNAAVVFEDLTSVLGAYVKVKDGEIVNAIPTAVNYYLLTGGEINFDSYKHRLNRVFDDILEELGCHDNKDAYRDGLKAKIQLNVFNEATLSSQSLVAERKRNLAAKGEGAFAADSAPDENGAYRIAVLGFGKTGQYAMEELYTHTTYITKSGEAEYTPTRFIADIYDVSINEKSGLFAHNHPLFRCLNEESGLPADTQTLINKADEISGGAYDMLYDKAQAVCGLPRKQAKEFIDKNMQLPVAVFHSQSCFTYPFMSAESADAAIKEARKCGIRDFVIALGDDERNIAMANVLIDSFKREYYAANGKAQGRHITIYVNLIESESVGRLNWLDDDIETFSTAYGEGAKPFLSVVPFGNRGEMFSYATLIDDYYARLYHYGYTVLTDENKRAEAATYLNNLRADYNAYRNSDAVSDCWLLEDPFIKLSNKSAQAYAVVYYERFVKGGGTVSADEKELMKRLEHERWSRFHISHGWIYADYAGADKLFRRSLRHHTCLCPYDKLLAEYTKQYDEINVDLGSVRNLVFGGGDR